MLKNFEYLSKKCPEVLRVCDEFFEYVQNVAVLKIYVNLTNEVLNTSLVPSFILHILNPFATYSNTSILHGAIPVTYMLLRNILEGVIRAVYGDLVLTELSYIKKREEVASKRLRDIIEDERIKKYVPEKVLKKALDLWIKTSSYAHSLTRRGKEGHIPRAEDYISKHGGPPSYGVIPLPTTYEISEADVEELHELAKNHKRD